MKQSRVVPVLLAGLVVTLGACGEDSGPNWIDGGLHAAQITELSIPDTIRASDTLRITLSAELAQPVGRPEFASLDAQRSEHSVEITVWASVDLWAGSGPIPPTSFTVLHEYQHSEPPPFAEGPFAVVLSEPEGPAVADTVYIAGD